MAGENYIGSKISLISLSDIRYVGILHSINAQDSTVGLKQVRSFGTEGRRGKPEEEILPSDNVFDYVVFRGKDIKDLQVFEPPPPPPVQPPTLPQDPAIMSMSGYPPMNPYMNKAPMYMQQPQPSLSSATGMPGSQPTTATTTPGANAGLNNQNYWQPPAAAGFGMDQQPPSALGNLGPSSTSKLPEAKNALSNDNDTAALKEKDPLDDLKAELEASDAVQPSSINEAAIEQLAKKVSEMGSNDDHVVTNELLTSNNNVLMADTDNNRLVKGEKTSLAANEDEEGNRSYQQHRQQQQNRRQYNQYHNNNNQHNQRNNYNRRFNNNLKKAELVIPSAEFDFEAANAKFDKNEVIKKDILGEGGDLHEPHTPTSEQHADQDKEDEVEIPKPDDFYDKSSSFFDNISCESKERSEQQQQQQQQDHEGSMPQRRSHYHEERKLNMETFGQATVDNSRYRHNNYNRNNSRGGGYRSNINNRGGYNRQYNNRNNNYGYNNNRRGFQQQQQQQPQTQVQPQTDAL